MHHTRNRLCHCGCAGHCGCWHCDRHSRRCCLFCRFCGRRNGHFKRSRLLHYNRFPVQCRVIPANRFDRSIWHEFPFEWNGLFSQHRFFCFIVFVENPWHHSDVEGFVVLHIAIASTRYVDHWNELRGGILGEGRFYDSIAKHRRTKC